MMKVTTKNTYALWLALAGALTVVLIAFAINFKLTSQRTESQARAGESENIRARDDWFYEQRAYPKKTIPWGARYQAIEQMNREIERLREAEGTESTMFSSNLPWISLGPNPIGNSIGQFPVTFGTPRGAVSGRVTAIALHPNYNGASNQTVYIGSSLGGVWRTTDNGASWTPLTDTQDTLAIGDIAIAPNNPNLIYAATGAIRGYYGSGLLKSTDGGTSWTLLTGPASATVPQRPAFINSAMQRIALDPTNANTVYVVTSSGELGSASSADADVPLGQRGIFKSTDGGATWALLDVAGNSGQENGTDVMLDPLNKDRAYAAFDGNSPNGGGIYVSENAGQSWTKAANGLPATFQRITLASGPAVAPSTNATIYAAIGNNARNLVGIFKSTDNGASWAAVTLPQLGGQTDFNLPLRVDPTNGNIVYYGTSSNPGNNGGTFWRSLDGGQSWTDLSQGDGQTGGLHADTHSIAVSAANHNIAFTGNDGGIWRTSNATAGSTATWTNLNAGLSITQFQAIALHPTDANFVIGGTQDNGSNRRTTSNNWDNVAEGDGGFAYIDQSNPQVLYHTYQNERASYGPQLSTDGGASFNSAGCNQCTATAGSMNPNDRVGFFAPMNGHPGFTGANGNVIYFGTQRLYRSADRGTTWVGTGASNDGFGQDLSKGQGRVSAITPHPQLENTVNPPGEMVWVGTSDGNIQVSTNVGSGETANWTNMTKAPLPNRFITDIAVDTRNRTTAIVTYSGFNLNTPGSPGHIFRTTDQGQTWTSIDGNLPDVPVNTVALDPLLPNIIWVGTDIGVFQTINGGITWTPMLNGLPKVPVFMLRYHSASRSLFAATHARGVFRLTLERFVATVSAADYARDKIASEGIAAAFGANLATGLQVASTVPLPTSLSGTTVRVRDSQGTERLAPLFFVAPQQINYQIPEGTATGPAVITVTSGDGTISIGTETIVNVGPAIFTADSSGNGFPAANILRVRGGQLIYELVATRNASNEIVAVPIDFVQPGDQLFLVLYGTGFRKLSAPSAATVTVDGTSLPIAYIGMQPGLVGLDQANVELPRTFIGKGTVNVQLTVDGRSTRALPITFR
jgi:uncharacterized protein (TIGR03437 family)